MKFNKSKLINHCVLPILCLLSSSIHATALDQYLIEKKLLNNDYTIAKTSELKELLAALSDEDSRILPLQIDQTTLIEQMRMYPDHLQLQGIITSADFTQFAASQSKEKIHQLLTDGMLENCKQIFENEFQRVNPYKAKLTLSSDKNIYHIQIINSQCKF